MTQNESELMLYGCRLQPPERAALKDPALGLSCRIPHYYAKLIDPDNPADPIRKQAIPTDAEFLILPEELDDPLGEDHFAITSRLVRRYKSRAVFLTTDICAMYCRHCFRRRFTGKRKGPASSSEIAEAAEYIRVETDIRELLLTGGDVLTLSPDQLKELVSTFRSARPDLVLRICTRLPVVDPGKVSDAQLAVFAEHDTAAFYLMLQYNHPRELTAESLALVRKFQVLGIPVCNQAVLLKGVNDNPDILEELMNALVAQKIFPYYLFQTDLAPGTSHFRVPLERGLEIVEELHRRLSGLAMPTYAVDLPGGGGKIALAQPRIIGSSGKEHTLRSYDGKIAAYYDPV